MLGLPPLATTEVSTKAIVLVTAVLAVMLDARFLEEGKKNLFLLYAANTKGKFTTNVIRDSCSWQLTARNTAEHFIG